MGITALRSRSGLRFGVPKRLFKGTHRSLQMEPEKVPKVFLGKRFLGEKGS